jgi:hypothetical protein
MEIYFVVCNRNDDDDYIADGNSTDNSDVFSPTPKRRKKNGRLVY